MAGVVIGQTVPNQADPRVPFAKLYVIVKHGDKRVYKSLGPAKAQVTVEVDKSSGHFRTDCEMWSISDDGWQLEFKVSRGDPHTAIPWGSNLVKKKEAEERWRREEAEREERRARAEYDRLRARFGDDAS